MFGGGNGSGRNGRLYAWQAEALDSWTKAGRKGIVEAVTGTGKTRVGQVAIEVALAEGRRAVVLVPTQELQNQWWATLRRDLPGTIRIGRLGGGHHDRLQSHDILIAIINSASSRGTDAPRGSLLIADECHRYATNEFRKALTGQYQLRLGLTATLERPDRAEKRLLAYFGPVCHRIGYARALSDSVVAPFSLALIGAPMSPSEADAYEELTKEIADRFHELIHDHGFVKDPFHRFMRLVKKAADEHPPTPVTHCAWVFLGALYGRKQLLATSPVKQALVTELAPAIWNADRTLIFTESKEVADSLANDLDESGISAAAVHSDLKPIERREQLKRFHAGSVRALVAPRVLDEGVDVPAADLAIIVAASKTRRQMIQRMGRVLRRKTDGRIARMAILHLQGTTEDPALGAHEAFLGEVIPLADDLEFFNHERIDDALAFLCVHDPLVPTTPPRMDGEPERELRYEILDDEDQAASTVLHLR